MINDMPFLDSMVINETLRIYSPAVRTNRESNIDYKYNGINISKDSVVNISIWVIHHDPEI